MSEEKKSITETVKKNAAAYTDQGERNRYLSRCINVGGEAAEAAKNLMAEKEVESGDATHNKAAGRVMTK